MEHVDVVLDLPVDDPVGLEENFTVFPDSDVQQLLRVTSALGSFGRAGEHLFDSLQHMVGATDRIVPSNVVVNFLQVVRRIVSQQDERRHQSACLCSRSRAPTSAAG